MLQYVYSNMDYLSTSQIQNELNLRGFFAATTPPASTPPASTPVPTSPSVTNMQVLGWSVDFALQNIGKPLKAATSTDLTSSQWSQVSAVAFSVAPQLNTQYGTNLAITQGLIDNNLHTRNYWLYETPAYTPPAYTPPASTPPAYTPPASMLPFIPPGGGASNPSMTIAQILKASVDFALQYYNYPTSSSTRVSISSAGWSNIINVAINKDKELESTYTVLAGMGGLSGLDGEIYGPCFDANGNLVTCGGTTDIGWGTKWGPTILSLLGTTLSLIGTTWQASQLRNQVSSTYYQTTGQTLGVGNTRDAELLAREIQRRTGMSYDQAYAQARTLLGLPPEEKSELEKYLLPLGIGIGAYLILRRS